jgi:RimJ/RimL family protein N-acetyltransferase
MGTIDLGGGLVFRAWQQGDEPVLARYADNRKVWRNVRDGFPHPYTLADATAYVSRHAHEDPHVTFAIAGGGEPIGSIGLHLGEDVHRLTAEIGYWVAEPFWGQGIATRSAKAVCAYGFNTLGLVRIHAAVFEWNLASMRVLEKAGFVREAILRKSVLKDGHVIDSVQYVLVR